MSYAPVMIADNGECQGRVATGDTYAMVRTGECAYFEQVDVVPVSVRQRCVRNASIWEPNCT